MICELAEVRYRVILMPSTLGSVLASLRKRSTVAVKDEDGCCNKNGPSSHEVKMLGASCDILKWAHWLVRLVMQGDAVNGGNLPDVSRAWP